MATVVRCLAKSGMVPYWKRIGLQLGLQYPELKTIQKDETEEYDRLTAMLDLWLRRHRATKQALMDAVNNIL